MPTFYEMVDEMLCRMVLDVCWWCACRVSGGVHLVCTWCSVCVCVARCTFWCRRMHIFVVQMITFCIVLVVVCLPCVWWCASRACGWVARCTFWSSGWPFFRHFWPKKWSFFRHFDAFFGSLGPHFGGSKNAKKRVFGAFPEIRRVFGRVFGQNMVSPTP